MPKHLDADLAAGPLKKRQKMTHDTPRTTLDSVIFANGDGRRLTASTTKIPNSLKQIRVDETRVAVGKPDAGGDVAVSGAGKAAVVEISSASESSEASDDDDEEEEKAGEPTTNGGRAKEDGHIGSEGINGWKERSRRPDEEAVQGDDEDAADSPEQEEPSFGELLKAREPEPIHVEAAFADDPEESAALTQRSSQALSAPSANSLGTVLSQALRTNDTELLESCFRVNDLSSVRATVERLQSNLVATLLDKLAEKMQSRPGRAGHLMVWVQWALVSHGGYLAGQPQLMSRLKSLHRVISERADALSPLLQLKGKLDMLNAQMELRKSMQRAAATANQEDEDAVIYVEGDDESSDDEDEEMGGMVESRSPPKRMDLRRIDFGDDEEDEDEEMPFMNGIAGEDDEDESDVGEDNLIDDEAEEGSEEEAASDDEEFDEELEEDEMSDVDDEVGPATRSAAATAGFARR